MRAPPSSYVNDVHVNVFNVPVQYAATVEWRPSAIGDGRLETILWNVAPPASAAPPAIAVPQHYV